MFLRPKRALQSKAGADVRNSICATYFSHAHREVRIATRVIYRRGTENSRGTACRAATSIPLRDLRGHEKKSKNHQNCNFGLNKIKYLQLRIFAKRDFFSRPASRWCNLRALLHSKA